MSNRPIQQINNHPLKSPHSKKETSPKLLLSIITILLTLVIGCQQANHSQTEQSNSQPIYETSDSNTEEINKDTIAEPIENIQKYATEKEGTISIEGMEETVTYTLYENQKANYILYIDKERYETINENDLDIITPQFALDETFPEVSMKISQSSSPPSEVIEKLFHELNTNFHHVSQIEQITDPLPAYTVKGVDGDDWNSPITRYYVFENKQNGSFIIEQNYFIEAAEGHAVRFDEMLKTFEIIHE